VNDVRHIEIHTVEPLVPNPTTFQVQIAIANLKRDREPGSDQIPAELIQAGVETLLSEIHKFIHFVSNEEEFPDQRKESVIIAVYKKRVKNDCNNYCGISLLQNCIQYPSVKFKSIYR
jgi:hypothetical protein